MNQDLYWSDEHTDAPVKAWIFLGMLGYTLFFEGRNDVVLAMFYYIP